MVSRVASSILATVCVLLLGGGVVRKALARLRKEVTMTGTRLFTAAVCGGLSAVTAHAASDGVESTWAGLGPSRELLEAGAVEAADLRFVGIAAVRATCQPQLLLAQAD